MMVIGQAALFWVMLNASGHLLVNHGLKGQHSKRGPLDALNLFKGLFLLLILAQLIQWLHLPDELLLIVPISAALGLVFGFKNQVMQWHHPRLWVLLALLVLTAWLLVFGMPLAAWDSWLGWEMKAQQWLDHGLSAHIQRYQDWIKQPGGWVSPTAHYPDGLSLLFYTGLKWFGNNQWFAWFLALSYVQLVITVINHLHQKGLPIFSQSLAGLMLLTLPLMSNHIAMYGYADVWLAMTLLLVVMRGELWNQHHLLKDGRLALMMCALLPAFKSEGWVWLALLLFSHLFSKFLIRKHRWVLVVMISLVVWVWFGLDHWVHSWAGRSVVISQDLIQLGAAFSIQLVPQDVSSEMFSGLFLQNNWSLLWYFLPAVLLIWAWDKYPKYMQVSQTFLICSFAAFVVLFTFTDASKWAENYTAINRISLQLSLVFVYLFITTWMGPKQRAASATP